MGGPGSGQWHRWDKQAVVEDCYTLDVNRMARLVGFSPDRWLSGSWRWTDADGGEPTASVEYDLVPASHGPVLRLRYALSPTDGSRRPVTVDVPLERTACHFGGVRWWFRCPGCGRRSAKLHLPPGASRFACRPCQGLYHQVQRESAVWQALRRAQKLRVRIGGDGSEGHYPRPRGMHRRRYERMLQKVVAADAEVDRAAASHFA